jgi:hypothetical protein
VAGFRGWNELERHVIRERNRHHGTAGEEGTDRDRVGEEEPKGEERRWGFRVVYVFDVSQTEGAPPPEPEKVRGDPGPWPNG